MQRNSHPLAWRPHGVSDTLDASQSFSGAMSAMTNLIPDPSTKGLWQCRPAAIGNAGFGGSAFSSGFSSGFGSMFSSPGFVSVEHVFGDYVYGLVATNRNPGHDEPFVFSLLTGNFVTVSGVTANNVPVSPPTTGAWIPPQIDMVGSKVIVTSSGFTGAFGVFFGYFDVTTPGAPVWHGANCTGTGFPTFLVAPTGIVQFGNRAYFLHPLPAQPAVVFSDVLSPTTNSAGGIVPVLTFGDNEQLTAIGGLPLSNLLGGIVQAVMVFKGVSNIFQISGDPAGGSTSPFEVNALNIPTGTLAPRSVTPTPLGLAFMSPDGLRIIDFNAKVGPIIGDDGMGIAVPFIYANTPSRIAAGCNGTVLRITTQNALVPATPYQEYWYDFGRQSWNGPHTSTCTCYSPYQNTFIVVFQGVNAALFRSDYEQSNTSTFVENGTQLTWVWATSFLPDTDQLVNCAMTETTLAIATSAGLPNITINAVQEDGLSIDTVTIASTGTAPLWGTAIWGNFIWGGSQSALSPEQLQWHVPICFARLMIIAQGTSASSVKIGTLHMRYQITRIYSNQAAVA